MQSRLDKIRQRLEAATPGPWWNESGTIHAPAWWDNASVGAACHPADCFNGNGKDRHSDADFIANAPTDIIFLLSEVERLQTLVPRCNWCGDIAAWAYGDYNTIEFACGEHRSAIYERLENFWTDPPGEETGG